MRVVGVDACPGGWIGISITDDGFEAAWFRTSIGELVDSITRTAPLDVVAIDIPIGLPDTGTRDADRLVYKQVGPRRSSVFMTPTREALDLHTSPAEARAKNLELTGKKPSNQALALAPKILEVDEWQRKARQRVLEAHPELSFWHMQEGDLDVGKKCWAGMALRRDLLEGVGVCLPNDLGDAGARAHVDDVLDAAAAAWTASRYHAGRATPYPAQPESGEPFLPTIWA